MKGKAVGLIVLLGGIVLLAGLFLWIRPGPSVPPAGGLEPAGPGTESVPLVEIADRKRISGPRVLRVRQGDPVRLRFISDRSAELHLHGYDRSLHLPADKVVVLEFTAELTGRFEYELHGHHGGGHAALGVIEVHPR